ncbi:MAG: hypothetical protein ACE14S_11045 [Candidatus Bathyarchaeia archaeon]
MSGGAGRSKSKSLISVPDDLLDEVAKASIKSNTSTSKFVTDALDDAVKMKSLGYAPADFFQLCQVMQANRVLGGSFVPTEILRYLTGRAYAEDKETYQAKWQESGVWYGKFLKDKFEDPLQAFKEFLAVTRWDVNEVEITRDKTGLIRLRCISNVLSGEETELLVKFIEGAVSSMGFRIEKRDYMKGIVALEMRK